MTLSKMLKCAAVAALCSSVAFAQAPAQQTQPQAPVSQTLDALDDDWGDVVDAPGAGAGADGSAARVKSDARDVLRRGTEISAEALASAPYLFFDRDAKGRLRLSGAKLENIKKSAAYQNFDKAIVRISESVDYKAGDTVDIVSVEKQIKLRDRSARIAAREGRGVVLESLGDKKFVIKLFEMWGVITGGESVVPTVSFRPIYCDSLTVPDAKIEASVVIRIEKTITPYLHQFFIIDKGADDGVKLGDFFRVKEKKRADQLSEELLEGQVVNVTPVSATLVVQKLFKSNLSVGDHVFLNRRPIQ